MNQGTFHAKQLHLVLIGGGHAQIQVLKSLGMNPINGLAITLITDVLNAPYSGMLPGFVEGVWREEDIHIDLTKLASFAGATLIHDEVFEIDAVSKQVCFENRPSIGYDILSLNCGAVPDLDQIKGARAHSIAVKPIAHFLAKLPEQIAENQPLNIIGAGVAGLELAFAFKVKYASQNPVINVFSRSKHILPTMPKRSGTMLSQKAGESGIHIHNNTAITSLSATELKADDGRAFAPGLNFVVTGVKPSAFITRLTEGLDETGFVAVSDTLQSVIYPDIFAAGDVASLTAHPREKAGVFAVRAGNILAQNIRHYIYNQPLKHWRPQKNYLSLIGTGDGSAVAIRNRFVMQGKVFWRLKCAIDKAFMDKFNELPTMRSQAPLKLPLYRRLGHDQADAIFKDMRCSGCAAKASASLLDTAMAKAHDNARQMGVDSALLAPDGAIAEDAGLTKAVTADLRHSFDSLNQMVSDPFLFAQIAVNHALSDLYVAGAKPLYAQAHINLEEASEPYQEQIATEFLTGSLIALAKAEARLVGGHTSQSQTASLGFAVTGAQTYDFAAYDAATSYVLVMTKELGIGTALAAHMRQKLSSNIYDRTLRAMMLSNQLAAQSFFEAGAIAMTDITGFGLARHAQNLTARLGRDLSFRLSLSSLSVMAELAGVIEAGLRSSIYEKNREAGLVTASPSAAKDWRLPLLFDPQTSGGVLAILPADRAPQAIAKVAAMQPHAFPSIIGTLETGNAALLVEL